MKILMTADAIGGVWTFSIELARALQPYGVEIVLATMGAFPTAEQREQVEEIPTLSLEASAYKLEWMEDPWQDVDYSGQWLLRLAEQVKPDLVHLNGYAHGSLPWEYPAMIVGHSCVLSWWYAVSGAPAPDEWKRYSHEAARGLHSVPMVLAPTRAMLTALERHYGCCRTGRVVPYGRDPKLFAAGEKHPMIFSAGRLWDEAKNIRTLQKVAPRLDWPVYVAGDDERPDGHSTEPTENVKLLGILAPQAVQPWYSRASIYALPARYEPFGISALEAALSGCALVLGDIPSLREVWGDTAVFVPPNDGDALMDAIQSLIHDPERREDLAARAYRMALGYTPERMALGYIAAYEELLSWWVLNGDKTAVSIGKRRS
jgi:glycosyltransferase involved in cell wall biosynthesis